MNEKQSFIIEDLDDSHIVIKADEEFRVRRQLELEASRVFRSDLVLLIPLHSSRRIRIVSNEPLATLAGVHTRMCGNLIPERG